MTPSDDTAAGDARAEALLAAVRELERHVATGGWDGPVRLFALVRTAAALRRDPSLRARFPADVVAAAEADGEHLTSVEQEGLPEAGTLEELLGGIAWPGSVDGTAVVVERIVVPPEAEADLPGEPEAALRALAEHPQRQDVRLAVAVLRDGPDVAAIRTRAHDSDDQVAVGQGLVPGLAAALRATLD